MTSKPIMRLAVCAACNQHTRDHETGCASCELKVCRACVDAGKRPPTLTAECCGNVICKTCDDEFAVCDVCKKFSCHLCTYDDCGRCGAFLCARCLRSCALCKSLLCAAHMSTATECAHCVEKAFKRTKTDE